MFCRYCKKYVPAGKKECPYCGRNEFSSVSIAKNLDEPDAKLYVLSFFIPIVGLILFLIWKNQYPERASSCADGATNGIITYIILSIIGFVFRRFIANIIFIS